MLSLVAAALALAAQVSFSSEDFVVERSLQKVVFSDNGTGRQEQSVRIRIQSDAAVRQYGVLTFSYRNDIERFEEIHVQVEKADGRIIATPESSTQDLPAAVARQSPTYSDQREKQIPVKSLGSGDVLEWRTRIVRFKPDVPNHFWFTYTFTKQNVILDERLQITVPALKYAFVRSPGANPEVHEENGRKTYSWKSSRLEPFKAEKVKPSLKPPPAPDVQLTTFKSWQEVGQWYGSLQKPKLELTPAIRQQAAELTKGLSIRLDKQRAIYQFVSTKFRYISISLGAGRYEPHSADEVLANQYGDCKDKHTLFAALLKASGIDAWPALVGVGLPFDDKLPSPAQFNHVITYIPENGSAAWLDSTLEVAPYGFLVFQLRGRQALIIPTEGEATLRTSAKELPFLGLFDVRVEGKFSSEGTLSASINIHARGDNEVMMKGAFQATPPAQWLTLAQNLSGFLGYAGSVSELDVDRSTTLDEPFHYSYKYERKNYPDWDHKRITPPFPPIVLIPFDSEDKPTEPTPLGTPARFSLEAFLTLPSEYSAETPANTNLHTAFADYSTTYSEEKGGLLIKRTFVVKQTEIAPSQWEEYKKFAKAVVADTGQMIQLVPATSTMVSPSRDSTGAAGFVQKAADAAQRRNFTAARSAVDEAERLNPQQLGLWQIKGFIFYSEGQFEKARQALKKEIEYHSGNEPAYRLLARVQRQLGHPEDELTTLRQLVKLAPLSSEDVLLLASRLGDRKKFDESAPLLETAWNAHPENNRLGVALIGSLLRGGKKAAGLAALAKLREQPLDAFALNSTAFALAETGVELDLAKQLAERAVIDYEGQLKDVKLADLTNEKLRLVTSLGITWDTLGWAAFRLGDLDSAEKYVSAAWNLLQHAVEADHLGQIYERKGQKSAAIHAYQLALAATHDLPETAKRLEKLGVVPGDHPTVRSNDPSKPIRLAFAEEISQLRSTPVAALKNRSGSAEFFLLFSAEGFEEARFITGDEILKEAVTALAQAAFKMSFPDQGPEKIARRGILSCSANTTPSCNLVFLPPESSTVN